MIKDAIRVYDAAFTGLSGGMNSGYLPDQLPRNQCANAINVTFRGGGKPKTRPGFPLVKLSFENPEDQVWFERENWQASAYYDERGASPTLIASIGGEIFRISFTDEDEGAVEKITPGVRNSKNTQVWMCQAEQYLIIQDGQSAAIIVEGSTATRSAGAASPVGVQSIVRGTGDDKLVVTVTTGLAHGYESGQIIQMQGAKQGAYNGPFVIDVIDDTSFTYEISAGSPKTPATGNISALGPNSVPVGTVMAFGMGRLWVASPDRREFVAGDISGGATNVITFSENTYLNEGGSFSLPQSMGRITAMNFALVNDTATGQGELMVGAEYGWASINAGIPRPRWKDEQIQRIMLRDVGCVGANAVTNVNGDVFFRANDGIRTYRTTRAEAGSWGHTPISREVGRYLDFDTPFWLESCQLAYFDNRLFVSTAPVQWGRYEYHQGIIALDFNTLGSIAGKQPPAYDGLWTGIRPVTLTTGIWEGEERCYAASYDQDEVNRLYRISKDDKLDGQGVRIPCAVETGGMDFEGAYNLKELYTADLWLSELWESVDWNVRFTSDRYPGWISWDAWNMTANTSELSAGLVGKDFRAQARPRVRLSRPATDCDPARKKAIAYGYFIQARIEWTGHARIDKLRLHAKTLDEETQSACPVDEEVGLYATPISDFSYTIVGSNAINPLEIGIT